MAEKTWLGPQPTAPSPAHTARAPLPPEAMACLALGAPDADNVGWLAGEVDNSLLLACLGEDTTTPEQQAPAQIPGPWSDAIWRFGNLAPGASHRGPATEDDQQRFDAFKAEDAHYDDRLNQERAALAEQAARDRAAGLPSRAVEQDDRMRALWDMHDRFANVHTEQGDLPAGYYIHDASMITERAGSKARKAAVGALGKERATNRALTGKPSVAQVEENIPALDAAGSSLWEGLDMHTRLDRIRPEGLDDQHSRAAELLAFFQHAGIGIDCEGYSREMVLNALPGSDVNTAYNATGWGRRAGGKGPGGASPLDQDGKLAVQPGDVLNIDPASEEERQAAIDAGKKPPMRHGHIGVVLQVVEDDQEVVMRLGHSTPNQNQYNGDTFLGSRPEGVRDDVYVYDKAEGTWHTVRGAFSDDSLASSKRNGLPLFSEFRTWDQKP